MICIAKYLEHICCRGRCARVCSDELETEPILGGVALLGRVKHGFEPLVEGFGHFWSLVARHWAKVCA